MKKIIIMLITILLLTSCKVQTGSNEVSKADTKSNQKVRVTERTDPEETEMVSQQETTEISETSTESNGKSRKLIWGSKVKKENKIEPLFREKIDASRQGVEMPHMRFASEMTKGDDGYCYYFRQKGEGKNKKIVFYKNNGIKICETKMPEKYQKKGYVISSFVKYGGRFFIEMMQYEDIEGILTSVRIRDGKWEGEIEDTFYNRIIIYDNCFYCCFGQDLTIIDLQGRETEISLEKEKEKSVQSIVDDKIYYCTYEHGGTTTAIRCNLDGSGKEKLFQYRWIHWRGGESSTASLRIDGEYFYLLEPYGGFTLTRIPMYGGKIKKIAVTSWFDLSKDSIFYVNDEDYICKVDKELKNSPEKVTKSCIWYENMPFFCSDGHLMVKKIDEEELEMIDAIWEAETDSDEENDILMNYSSDYYWVTENGKIKSIIKGGEFKKEYYELYEWVKKLDELE